MAEFPEGYSEFGTALADGDFALVNKRKTLISRWWTYIQSKLSAGAVTVGSLVTSGTVDGRDVSTDGSTLDAHVASTSNPHAVTAAQAGAVAVASHAALSVIGRSANSTGDAADIAAANDGEVLRRSGTTLGFGTVSTAGIADTAVTEAKLSTALQTTIAALIDTADPLSVFPSYQTINVTSRYTDFATVNAGFSPYNAVGSGTGNASAWSDAVAGRHGLLTLETGTTTAGSYFIGMNSFGVAFGSGVYRWRGDFWIPTASDGTDTFSVRAGFIDATSGECTDGVYFRYQHSVNGGRWEFVTRNNSTETATDTGVAGVAAIASMEIEVNAGGTSANARINGTSVATNTTNIPTGATRSTGIGLSITKSAGTTNRTIIADLMGDRFERTTAI